RAQVASVLGEEPNVRRPASAQAPHAEALRARYVPVPQRRRSARRPSRRLYRDRYRLPCRPDARQKRDAPDGLRRVWPARRRARDQNGRTSTLPHRKEYRNVSPPAQVAWLLLRLVARTGDDRHRVLPLDAVDLPANLRHVVRRRAAARATD